MNGFKATLNTMKYYNRFLLTCLGHLLLLLGCNEKPINAPLIHSFSPQSSTVEGIITIRGINFGNTASDNLVRINGSNCSILAASDTQLKIKADPGVSSGILSVTVNHLAAVAGVPFTLIPHTIDSIYSYQGLVGDKIDFSGRNFTANSNDVEVAFNTKVATISNYRLQNDTTYFSADVPVGATTGKIYVRIGAVTVSSKKDFTVN